MDLFERTATRHSSDVELFARDYAPYFRALRAERTIAAHDARLDPPTSCFAESYLVPLGIEETFASLMSNFVALALEHEPTFTVRSICRAPNRQLTRAARCGGR